MKLPPQFMHVGTYARSISNLASPKDDDRRRVVDIVNEAIRLEGYCPHIDEPKTPQLIYGEPLESLPLRLDALLKAGQTVINKTGQVSKRAVRQDAHVLLVAVYSYKMDKEMVNNEVMNFFFNDCIQFHKEKFGSVDSAILHLDETYYHIHVFTIDTNAKRLHPGFVADARRKTDKSYKVSYRKAMSELQDNFYQTVAEKYGMTRYGPRIERLSSNTLRKIKNNVSEELAHYQEELELKKKAKEAEYLVKLRQEERFYLEQQIIFEQMAQDASNNIEYMESQLSKLTDAQQEILELRIELVQKDALIAKYREADNDDESIAAIG